MISKLGLKKIKKNIHKKKIIDIIEMYYGGSIGEYKTNSSQLYIRHYDKIGSIVISLYELKLPNDKLLETPEFIKSNMNSSIKYAFTKSYKHSVLEKKKVTRKKDDMFYDWIALNQTDIMCAIGNNASTEYPCCGKIYPVDSTTLSA